MSDNTLFETTSATAEISLCGQFRTRLTRRWGDASRMIFVMLNPSTADAVRDDPTIRRCIGFARREGLGGIAVINLFTRRTPSPKALVASDDPKGPDADSAITQTVERAKGPREAARWGEKPDVIVCAWGAPPAGPAWWRAMHHDQVERVYAEAHDMHKRLFSLGTTAGGHPRHPLYLPADAPLVEIKPRPLP